MPAKRAPHGYACFDAFGEDVQRHGCTASLNIERSCDVPSVAHLAPLPAWAGAVEQGRQVVRAALIDQNLPGLSVAVGSGGDVVWAEGFGWADLENRGAGIAGDAVQDRHRLEGAHVGCGRPAAGEGRLNLDDVIQRHVPEFPEKQQPVTLRQLMAHVARRSKPPPASRSSLSCRSQSSSRSV